MWPREEREKSACYKQTCFTGSSLEFFELCLVKVASEFLDFCDSAREIRNNRVDLADLWSFSSPIPVLCLAWPCEQFSFYVRSLRGSFGIDLKTLPPSWKLILHSGEGSLSQGFSIDFICKHTTEP